MKRFWFLSFLLVFIIFTSTAEAQKRRVPKKSVVAQKSAANVNTAIVVDERLAVLRVEPSLYAKAVQRMRLGRVVQISGSKQADGITFYRVMALPNNFGWVQSEAVAAKNRAGDDGRMAKLVQAFDGFEQIECATLFLETFNDSPLRPAIQLLLGDLTEEIALKLSAEATRRLSRREMTASGAPLHSFYLNYVSLDRYRRLGINFLFNSSTKLFHYNGASWKEIIAKFPKSAEAAEAQKRLDALKEKMEKTEK
ncbi:MAG: hypothetical protein WA584_22380 [Pyrinomonadaceae bacterium]